MPSLLQILYHSGGVIAVNKPPGLAVHAAPGPGGSVLKELIDQTGLSDLTPVHRLDKDASGVLVFAETKSLAAEIQRTWEQSEKTYLALCDGTPSSQAGIIDAPILEHQTGKPERLRNAVRWYESQHPGVILPPLPVPKTSAVHPAGRSSQTAYTTRESFGSFSLVETRPHQGRMHHIRVHLAHIGHPLAVDPLYGKRSVLTERDVGGLSDSILLNRLPLHAARLTFSVASERITLEAALPQDIEATLAFLRVLRS
ncbi:MAG: pseudouridine synthase [Planctomycetota bacterium]